MPSPKRPSDSVQSIFDLTGDRLTPRHPALEAAPFVLVPLLLVVGYALGGAWGAALLAAAAVPPLAAAWGGEVGGGLAWGLGGGLLLHALFLAPPRLPFALIATAALVRAAMTSGAWRRGVEGALALRRLRRADLERDLNDERHGLAETRRRVEALRDRTERLRTMTALVQAAEESLETDRVARTIARRAHDAVGRGRIVVYRRRPGTDQSDPIAVRPGDDPAAFDGEDFNPIVYDRKAPLLIPDLGAEFRVRPRRGVARPVASLAIVPLQAGHEVWGCLRWESEEPGVVDREDLALLSAISVPATLALQNADLFLKTESMARIDGLTGALRRHVFDSRLEAEVRRSARYKQPLSLLMIDLDRFKSVNDTWGHQAGDALLKAVSAALRARVASPGLVARYGGEEFAVLLPDTPKARALEIAEDLRRGAREVKVPEVPRDSTISVGVATYPEDGGTPVAFAEAADWALYRAKESGRDRVEAAG